MPTVPDTVFTWNCLYPLFGHFKEAPVGLKGASNATYPEYAPGVLLGELTASKGVWAPYNPTAVDGTQHPGMIVRWPVSVDASNNILRPGDFQGTPGVVLQSVKAIDAVAGGECGLTDIIGLDAAALAYMQGVVREGVIGANEQDTVTLSAATNTWDSTITGPDGVAHAFLGLAGNVTAASLTATLQAALGIGSVYVTLSGLVYTLTFGGAWGTQPVTVASTGHTITATAAQVTAGAAASVASGTKGWVSLLK